MCPTLQLCLITGCLTAISNEPRELAFPLQGTANPEGPETTNLGGAEGFRYTPPTLKPRPRTHKRYRKVSGLTACRPPRRYVIAFRASPFVLAHLHHPVPSSSMERRSHNRLSKPGKSYNVSSSYRPISLLSSLDKLYEKILETRLSNHLLNKGLIINAQSGFRPQHSRPQQDLRLVEHISEGFKRKHKTVAVIFDVAKAIDRVWPVITYACSAHANGTALNDLQIIQNNFSRRATDAQWYIKNLVLHRDLELPTISTYMKDASERFFSIAINHPNPLISSAASYEPPLANHFIRRLRKVLTDPPDDLTTKVEKLNNAFKDLEE
ncbi:Probable RNA-directed DNA polymerase from transposon X-element [Eumeta japonica]|uniref:Probable RNA-directed DNA polymerase from transposon X-element n=1 Tax=Eumeta variegata TaxID=151549 RepID=A0A4C1UKF8_EUMVA|nr:Probable RNA-directed DNA polymerase from transposon X-element [Eumeta japonica]